MYQHTIGDTCNTGIIDSAPPLPRMLCSLTLMTGWREGDTLACTPESSSSQRTASCLTWARIGWVGHVEEAEGGSGCCSEKAAAAAGSSRAEMESGTSGLQGGHWFLLCILRISVPLIRNPALS